MEENFHRTCTCLICGHVEHARVRGFYSSVYYCGKHRIDEVEFHQSLPERNRMSKDDKALERIYARRWKTQKEPKA